MRVRNSVLSFTSAAMVSILVTVIGLIATPHLLKWLGDERFGAFRALSEWMGYLVLFELGLTGATMTVLAKALAQGDEAAAGATRVCLRAFARVAMGMLAGGAAVCALAPWLVPVSESLRSDLRWAAAILACGVLLAPLTVFRLLLDSAQKGYIVNCLLLVNSLVLTTLSLLFAYRGGGISGQAAATVSAAVVFTLLISTFAWRKWLRTNPAADTAGWKKMLWKSNWQTVALDVSGRVAVMSDSIIISLFLSPAMVTPFVLTQRLIQAGAAQVLGIGNASWAAMANLFHANQHELLRQRLIELSRLTAVLSGVVVIPLTAYNHAFIRLWVGERAYAGDAVTILAGVTGLLAGWWSLWGWVFRGAGILRPLVPTSIASAAVNVVVSIACTAWLGWIAGPLIGTVAGFFAVTAWRYPLMFKRHLDLDPVTLLRALAPVLVVLACTGLAAWWAARIWPPAGWLSLAGSAAVTAMLFSAVSYFGVLTLGERRLWRQRFRLLANRGGGGMNSPAKSSVLADQSLGELLWQDVRAHFSPDECSKIINSSGRLLAALRVAISSPGFRCLALYRCGRVLRLRIPVVGRAASGALFWLQRHWYSCGIASTARIGGGTILPHPINIIVGGQAVIGERAWLFHNVTIGGAPGKHGMPAVGADCRILTGAVLSGPIHLGDCVTITANAVVSFDVPSNSIVRAPKAVVVSGPRELAADAERGSHG